MARFNGRTLLRGQIRTLTRNGYPVPEEAAQPPDTATQVTILGIDALDQSTNAKNIVKALNFETYCGVDGRTGIPSFYAQCEGGKSWAFTPVMPKDVGGNPMIPLEVYNGARGYLVLNVSENARVEENEKGQRGLTVRPEFLAFCKTKADADKFAAERAAKPAEPAKK